MTVEEKLEKKEAYALEIRAHLAEISELATGLLAARDPFSVYNSVQKLRSLVGQIASASWRYRQIS